MLWATQPGRDTSPAAPLGSAVSPQCPHDGSAGWFWPSAASQAAGDTRFADSLLPVHVSAPCLSFPIIKKGDYSRSSSLFILSLSRVPGRDSEAAQGRDKGLAPSSPFPHPWKLHIPWVASWCSTQARTINPERNEPDEVGCTEPGAQTPREMSFMRWDAQSQEHKPL